ncbi:MAG: YitT family protein [Flavobacteriales bacterium]|nr:YitT family protein [Flavobacteriales bacterium]
MRRFVRDAVIRFVLRPERTEGAEPSRYVLAKGFRELKIDINNTVKDVVLIGLGVFSAAFGLESFLLANKFIDGGATGVALMVTALLRDASFTPDSSAPEWMGLVLPGLLLVINLPFVYLAYRTIDRPFAVRTALGIAALALVVATVHLPEVTHDKLLGSVFGGFFLGAGIGLAVRGGGVIDGTEVLAIAVSRKLHTTVGDVITVINVVVFSVAAWLLSVETALYSMLTYLAASKTMDFVIEGIEEYMGVTIVSSHHEELRVMITEKLQRGITVLRGKRGFGRHGHNHDVDVIYCVITRLEVGRLTTEVEKVDPNAFVVMSPVKDITGGIVKKRRHKH